QSQVAGLRVSAQSPRQSVWLRITTETPRHPAPPKAGHGQFAPTTPVWARDRFPAQAIAFRSIGSSGPKAILAPILRLTCARPEGRYRTAGFPEQTPAAHQGKSETRSAPTGGLRET